MTNVRWLDGTTLCHFGKNVLQHDIDPRSYGGVGTDWHVPYISYLSSLSLFLSLLLPSRACAINSQGENINIIKINGKRRYCIYCIHISLDRRRPLILFPLLLLLLLLQSRIVYRIACNLPISVAFNIQFLAVVLCFASANIIEFCQSSIERN